MPELRYHKNANASTEPTQVAVDGSAEAPLCEDLLAQRPGK